MKRSVEIIGQPVISVIEGKELGLVKELLVNYTNGTVAALVVDDGKWYRGAKLLPFEAIIAGLGEDAVIINSSDDVVTIADRPELEKLLEVGVKVIGTRVITKGGRNQGKFVEFVIDTTGKINVCELEKTDGEIVDIPAHRVITYGKQVVIIADEEEYVAAPVAKTAEINVPTPTVAEPPVVQAAEPTPAAPAPAFVPQAAPAPQVEAEKEAQPADDSAKKFDDKHRKFLLGKKASRRIETDNGMLIVDQGGEITEEVLQKAKLAGKFVELSMNIG